MERRFGNPTYMFIIYLSIFLFGLLFGSFFNVCMYRIPREHFSLTAQTLATLRAQAQNNLSHAAEPGFIWKLLLSAVYAGLDFFGVRLRRAHDPVPPDVLAKLIPLQAQDFVTLNDFIDAVETALGKDDAARHGAILLHHATTHPESIVFPGSHCPACHAPIHAWENIPVFSFLFLRGRCRACHTRISWRYPLIELLTALLFCALVYRFGMTVETLVYIVFVSLLIIISFIDLDHRLIPDVLSAPGIGLGLLASAVLPITWAESLLGMLLGGGLILLTGLIGSWFFKKEAMGGGDVKLMALIGAFLGWKMVFLTIFFASVVGALIGIIYKLITKDEYIPFGPFLSLGALCALFWGTSLLAWYWNHIFPY